MATVDRVVVPRPTEFVRDDEFFLLKIPTRPYVVEDADRTYLCRLEQWGIVEYDYSTDQFSALADPDHAPLLPRAPLGVYWLVTAPCNLRCIHCYGNVEELPRKKLSEEEQAFIADRIIQAGAMRVTINGGEPLLRKDTAQIIERLADNHVAVVLGTNGTYLSEHLVSSIRRTSLVEISLDSHAEDVNNSIRISRTVGGNAYVEALKAIELCVAHGIKLRILTCINAMNMQHVVPMADLLYGRGVRDWSISWTLFAGRARFIYPGLVAPSAGPVRDAIDRVRQKYPDLRIKFSNRSNATENNRYSCLIFPNGRVFAEDLAQGKKIPFHSLFDAPLVTSWTEENFDIQKHFERWTANRIKYFSRQ